MGLKATPVNLPGLLPERCGTPVISEAQGTVEEKKPLLYTPLKYHSRNDKLVVFYYCQTLMGRINKRYVLTKRKLKAEKKKRRYRK